MGISICLRALADAAHYPAIDLLRSQSRLFDRLALPQQCQEAARFRHWLARHEELQWLIQIGEYKTGADAEADQAISHHARLMQFLQQQDCDSTL